jgi:gas vesicle protein
MKRSKMALSIIGAMATGTIIGLLIAPQKGEKLRRKLKRKTGKWMQNAKNAFHANANKYMEDVEEQSPSVIPVM